MPDRRPDPKDTIRILDRLVERKLLNETQFRDMHHLGGSMTGFRSYCSTIASFRRNGTNQNLHDKLQKMLDSYESTVDGHS